MRACCLVCVIVLFLLLEKGHDAAAEPLLYQDKLGRNIIINIPVKRAVLFEVYELMPAIGGFDGVAGLGHFAFEDDLIRATNPDIAREIPSVGTRWNINTELLLKVRPDVILTVKNADTDSIRFLEEKGLNVLALYPENLAELYEVMRFTGKLFARENKVEHTIQEMEEIFGFIRTRVEKIPLSQRRRALMLMSKQSMVAGRSGLYHDLLDLIGVVNCVDSQQSFPEVSLERIIMWNPELIFYVWYARYSTSDLVDNPQWRHISAVREHKVYKSPMGSTWSPRIAPIALWMAAKAYPERFKDVDVDKKIDRFYRKVYGVSYASLKEASH